MKTYNVGQGQETETLERLKGKKKKRSNFIILKEVFSLLQQRIYPMRRMHTMYAFCALDNVISTQAHKRPKQKCFQAPTTILKTLLTTQEKVILLRSNYTQERDRQWSLDGELYSAFGTEIEPKVSLAKHIFAPQLSFHLPGSNKSHTHHMIDAKDLDILE